MKEVKEQIYRQTTKIVNIIKKDPKEKHHDIMQKEFNKLYKILKQEPKLLVNINRHDVWNFFHPISISKKHVTELTKVELRKEIENFFFGKPHVHHCYFRIGRKEDFPEGYRLGSGVFHTLENLPNGAQSFIKNHMPYEHSEELRIFSTSEKYIKFRENDAYLEIQ
mgnify:CR=1 FL=1